MSKNRPGKILKPSFHSQAEEFGIGQDPVFWIGQLLEELANFTASKHAMSMVEAIYEYYSIDRDDVDEDELAEMLGEEVFQDLMTDAFMCHLFFTFMPTSQEETISESFMREVKRLHPRKRYYIEQARASFPSLYQIRQISPEKVTILDVLLDEEHTVDTRYLEAYPLKSIFMGRFVGIDEQLYPLALSVPLSPMYLPTLRAGILAGYESELKILRDEGIMTPFPLKLFLSLNEGALLDLMDDVGEEAMDETLEFFATDYLVNNVKEARNYLNSLDATAPNAAYLPLEYEGLSGFAVVGMDEKKKLLTIEAVESTDLEEAMEVVEAALDEHIEFNGEREFSEESKLLYLDPEQVESGLPGFLEDFPTGPLDSLEGMSMAEAFQKGQHLDVIAALRDAVIYTHDMHRIHAEEHRSPDELEELFQNIVNPQ